MVPLAGAAHLDDVDRELLEAGRQQDQFLGAAGRPGDRTEVLTEHPRHQRQWLLAADRAHDRALFSMELRRAQQVGVGIADLGDAGAAGVDLGQQGPPPERVVHHLSLKTHGDQSTSGHPAGVCDRPQNSYDPPSTITGVATAQTSSTRAKSSDRTDICQIPDTVPAEGQLSKTEYARRVETATNVAAIGEPRGVIAELQTDNAPLQLPALRPAPPAGPRAAWGIRIPTAGVLVLLDMGIGSWRRSRLVHATRAAIATLAVIGLGVASASCSLSPEQSTDRRAELQARLMGLRAEQAKPWGVTVPGYAAAVNLGDRDVPGRAPEVVRAVSGSAAPLDGRPLELTDRFHVGSVTKTFTAALILQLDQSGELSIDEPLSRWIDFPGGETVTIAMLLGHTSGIPDFTRFDYSRESTPEQSIALVAGRAFEFTPGSSWAYSNTNYTMLGLIAEKVTSRPWAELVESRFFRPLGLDDTYVWTGVAEGPTVSGARLACGESAEASCAPPRPGFALLPVEAGYDWTVAWSAGAVVSTPADLAKWMAALVGGDELDVAHRRLLTTPTPQSVASDFGQAVAALGATSGGGTLRWVGHGLGLFVYEIDGVGTAWGHEGSINGFVANAAYVESTGQAIAVTSNFAESDSFSALGAVAVTASGWSENRP